jgi:type VI secretion system secreted protein Hcp
MNRIAFLAAALAFLIAPMALGKDYLLSVKGQRQGQFKAEGFAAASNKIRCIGFEYNIQSPRDSATGQASGKRQHGSITIIKEWGASSPLFHNALTTNEALTSVEFQFTKTDARTGSEVIYHTITLTNATVAEIKQYIAPKGLAEGAKHTAASDSVGYEEITLVFDQGLIMANVEGKTTTGTAAATGKATEQGVIRPTRIPPPGETKALTKEKPRG